MIISLSFRTQQSKLRINMQNKPKISKFFKSLLCLILLTNLASSALALPEEETEQKLLNRYLKSGTYMTVDEIKPGMQGWGLSVFQGTKIERFNISVVGILKKMIHGRDAILVKLSGQVLGPNNIIQGMSGSPVYINNKLIGAVSFGFPFAKEPFAGITPIADMLDSLNTRRENKVPIAKSTTKSDSTEYKTQSTSNTNLIPVSEGAPNMIPLMAPVSLVGFSPAAQEFLSDKFKSLGLGATSAGGGAQDNRHFIAQASKNILPGSPLSALLVTGDFNIVATGTATCNFNGQVLGFGHPFLQAGAVEFPMAPAYILQVMPTLLTSFKLSSPGPTIGTITNDRPWSVSGQIGKTAQLVPASYTIVDHARQLQKSYKCNVVNHPDLTPELLAATVLSSIDSTHQHQGAYIAKVKTHIESEGIEPITRNDIFSNLGYTAVPGDNARQTRVLGDPVSSFIYNLTDSITNNRFSRSKIKSLKVDVELFDERQTAKLEQIALDKSVVKPGETVTVSYQIRPYNEDPFWSKLSLTIPRDTPDGPLALGLANGYELKALRKRMGIIEPEPESLAQIAKRLKEEEASNTINLVAALSKQSYYVNGIKLNNPPPQWKNIFFSNRHTKVPQLVRGEVKSSAPINWLVKGAHILAIEVRSDDKAEAKQAMGLGNSNNFDDSITITEQAKKALDSDKKSTIKGSGASSSGTVIILGKPDSKPGDTSNSEQENKTVTAKKEISISDIQRWKNKAALHTRPYKVFRQNTEESFLNGTLHNCNASSFGMLMPGLQKASSVPFDKSMRVWSQAFANGQLWFSTDNAIYRWSAKDKDAPVLVTQLNQAVCIPALAADLKGNLYFSPSPSGEIWQLNTASGETSPKLVSKIEESIITSLCVDNENNLYAGAASSGKVYKITDPLGKKSLSTIFDTKQAHVNNLWWSPLEQKIFVSCGEQGAVYTINSSGQAKSEYQSKEKIVTAAVRNKRGDLIVSCANQGKLMLVKPSGQSFELGTSDCFYTLDYDSKNDVIYSGDAEGDICLLKFDPIVDSYYSFTACRTDQEAILSLLCQPDGSLFAASSNLASIRHLKAEPAEDANYDSPVFDAGTIAAWNYILAVNTATWSGKDPSQKLFSIKTRSGNSLSPDSSWSAWQDCQESEFGNKIISPPGRYLQYKLNWNNTLCEESFHQAENRFTSFFEPLRLGRIEIFCSPKDSSPQIREVNLQSQSYLSGKSEFTVQASDPDLDNMVLALDISKDAGATFIPIEHDIRAKSMPNPVASIPATQTNTNNKKPLETKPSKEESSTSTIKDVKPNPMPETESKNVNKKLKSNLTGKEPVNKENVDAKDNAAEKDQEKSDKEQNPDTNKDSNTSNKDSAKEPDKDAKSTAGNSAPTGLEKFSYNFDSTKFKDGLYIISFTLDDMLSDPQDHSQAKAIRSIVIDNTKPEIDKVLIKKDNASNCYQIDLITHDKQSPIVNATYKVDGTEPYSFAALQEEPSLLNRSFYAPSVKSGKKVEIEVMDKAGNKAIKTVSLK